MGVPAFFRWISRKYPKIIAPALEDEAVEIDGVEYPGDYSAPNRNGELDNLYLDMNGIVHPCTHPEGRPPPENEDEMMLEVFRYTDRVVTLARPRKVLMMAVDGVAPRAKMNQQRSRRFRTAMDAKIAAQKESEKLEEIRKRGEQIDDAIHNKKAWDANVITPGTPFMEFLATTLRFWVAYKLNTDPAWKNLKVIISDASTPGEGEHKIMELIRSQRNDPEYNPNTSHCIYGLDADLIFLSLATHEPHFRVLREDVFAQNKVAKASSRKEFIWLDIGILRQYLDVELNIPGTGFTFNLERAIDDWIFMAFFCGNDFLPHLPSLDVRENGLDLLLKCWRKSLRDMGGYITHDGDVDLKRAQILLRELASFESDILRRRRAQEVRRQANEKGRADDRKRQKIEREQSRAASISKTSGESAPIRPMDNLPLYTPSGESVGETHLTNQELVAQRNNITMDNHQKVQEAVGSKRALEEDEIGDNVQLGNPGYHDRYYEAKFKDSSAEFLDGIAFKYIEGVCWVLNYYYQGCHSWTWFYPYHYAPFAEDLVNIADYKIEFDGGEPFAPFEQLMSVLPAASSHTLPKLFRPLMEDSDSPIIDFYPEEFPIDMNGKKMSWQGVVLLPFIEEDRLLAVVRAQYDKLSDADRARNARGEPVLMVAPENVLREDLKSLYDKPRAPFVFHSFVAQGLCGTAFRLDDWRPEGPLICPVTSPSYQDIPKDMSLRVEFKEPANQLHKSMLLQGFKEPNLVLSYDEREQIVGRRDRSDRGDDRPDRRDYPPEQYSEPRALRYGGYMAFLQDLERQHQRPQELRYTSQSYNPGGYGGSGGFTSRGGFSSEKQQYRGFSSGYQNPSRGNGHPGFSSNR